MAFLLLRETRGQLFTNHDLKQKLSPKIKGKICKSICFEGILSSSIIGTSSLVYFIRRFLQIYHLQALVGVSFIYNPAANNFPAVLEKTHHILKEILNLELLES